MTDEEKPGHNRIAPCPCGGLLLHITQDEARLVGSALERYIRMSTVSTALADALRPIPKAIWAALTHQRQSDT